MRRNLKRMMAGAAAGVALIGASVAVAAPAGADTEPAAETTGCRYGQWPGAVEGRPAALQAGAAAGLYIWHDSEGWHLFATHPGHDKAVFRGTVRASSHVYGIGRHTEGRDAVVVTPRDKAVDFRFDNYGYLDGVAFRVSCGRGIAVSGTLDGHRLTPGHVFVGADGHHPSRVPFVVTRTR